MATRSPYWQTVAGPYPESPPYERMTSEGVEYMLKHQKAPPKEQVRADSAGLQMHVEYDASNRPINTFELQYGQTKRGTWMAPYCAPMYQQIRINRNTPTPAQAAKFEDDWRANQQALANGTWTLPEIG